MQTWLYIVCSISGHHVAYFIHVIQIIFHIYTLLSYSYQWFMGQWCTAKCLINGFPCRQGSHTLSRGEAYKETKKETNIRDLMVYYILYTWFRLYFIYIFYTYIYLITCSYSYQGCMSQWCTAMYLVDCCVGEVHIESHMYRVRLIKRHKRQILGILVYCLSCVRGEFGRFWC